MTKERLIEVWEAMSEEQKIVVALLIEAVKNPPEEQRALQTELCNIIQQRAREMECQTTQDIRLAEARANMHNRYCCSSQACTSYDLYKQLK